MKAPESIQTLQSFKIIVNYLKRFSPILSELSEPLHRLTKQNTVWAWESEQQQAFEKHQTCIDYTASSNILQQEQGRHHTD